MARTGKETYSSAVEEARNYTRWVVSAFAPFFGRSVLEIGMGHGGFYHQLPPLQHYIGADLDAELVKRAQGLYPTLRFVQADIAEPGLADRLAGTSIDTVLCANVLEHVEDDRAAMANLLGVLSPGGHLLLLVPAFQRLYNDLDRLAGHVRRYSWAEVAALVPGSNADIRRLEYFNPIGPIGWLLNGLIAHRSLESRAVTEQVRLFDTYVVPISKFLNPLTRRFFGQSVLCVVRKR